MNDLVPWTISGVMCRLPQRLLLAVPGVNFAAVGLF